MDTKTFLAIAIFALVVIAVLIRFRKRISIIIKGPGVELDVKAENPDNADLPLAPKAETPAVPVPITPVEKPGVVIADATSRKGGILASSDSGVDTQRVDVEGDILAESKKTPPDPKA